MNAPTGVGVVISIVAVLVGNAGGLLLSGLASLEQRLDSRHHELRVAALCQLLPIVVCVWLPDDEAAATIAVS